VRQRFVIADVNPEHERVSVSLTLPHLLVLAFTRSQYRKGGTQPRQFVNDLGNQIEAFWRSNREIIPTTG